MAPLLIIASLGIAALVVFEKSKKSDNFAPPTFAGKGAIFTVKGKSGRVYTTVQYPVDTNDMVKVTASQFNAPRNWIAYQQKRSTGARSLIANGPSSDATTHADFGV